jgi:hypothetical protein
VPDSKLDGVVAGRTNHEDFAIVQHLDKSSPKLYGEMLAAGLGRRFRGEPDSETGRLVQALSSRSYSSPTSYAVLLRSRQATLPMSCSSHPGLLHESPTTLPAAIKVSTGCSVRCGPNQSGKRVSITMLCIVVGILAVSLSYVFVKSVHQAAPSSQPNAPMLDKR